MPHTTFEPGELALPIHRIIWAPDNDAHYNHLHVEGFPHVHGTLNNCTSKWTEAITEIRGALDGAFGEGDHYEVWDDTLGWTHMGVYNCRNIAGTSTPSQHAFSNAIDIGPYYGEDEQLKFYNFLTMKEDDVMRSWFMNYLKSQNMAFYEALKAQTGTPGGNASYWGVDYPEPGPSQAEWDNAFDTILSAVLQAGVFAPEAATVDSHARSLAKKALDKLTAIKNSI